MLRPALPVLLAASLLGASALPAAVQAQPSAAQTNSGSALSVEQARAAAIRILNAVKSGNAQARFAQFSPEMQAVTSPSMIAATMRTQPKVLSYELLSVRSGMSGSTVEAELTTKAGKRVVFMVLNSAGKIERYYIDRADDASSTVALQFVQAVSTGNFITAQSFLSPSVQKELTPAVLQRKWLGLQRETGTFVNVGRAVEAESTPDTRLVLVNVQFNRLSDNLYVILNSDNQITGVDFPENPAGPS
ncbi:DUF3887 domain-containing protein [Synechococcus sp. HK05]|uniref:DUF3887 domain-containing protein n=1 Tax=Synechococcus sp. HK05 TaxID=2725975 RepID=UPI001C3893A9|nr:DUF3887 domain-containing protein [Synechococcus sp. HK05]MBV2350571.1 DUF3887 domain-containing protein [Synechococcus sp. HK05]